MFGYPKPHMVPQVSSPFGTNLQANTQAGIDRIENTFNTLKNEKRAVPGFIDPNNRYNPKNRDEFNGGGAYGGLVKRTLWSIYRDKIMEAFNNRRIFTVYGNNPAVRQALLSRGWLERLAHGRFPKIQQIEDELLIRHVRKGNDYEAVAISRLLNTFPSFFIWQDRGQPDYCSDVKPYRNVIRRGRNLDFCTKVGLIGCAEQEQWVKSDGKSCMSYPRFYRLGGAADDQEAFIKDFKLTQCLSLMRYARDKMSDSQSLYDFDKGSVPTAILNFALNYLKKCARDLENTSIDVNNANEPAEENAAEWKSFILQSHEIIFNNAKFRGGFKDLLYFVRQANVFLSKFMDKYPNMKWDGYRNLWILKPGYQCRGNGITLRYMLDDILTFATSNANRRYIVQKYVERPLLIYKTKFDMRLYMLLTISDNLFRIWLYKDCYLKFCSHEWNLNDLSEKIHLTNNTVQRKYKNERNRDPRLPVSNMWSLEKFQDYLKAENTTSYVWESKIVKGIKENLIAVVLASLEETEFVPNAFELYGCDFMLDNQLNPILIEVNATPDMSASTEVTQRLCPNVLKDVVRVVVDLPNKPFSSTGQFELIYEENYRGTRDFHPDVSLSVAGRAMQLRPFRAYRTSKKIKPIYKPVAKKISLPVVNSNGKGFTVRTQFTTPTDSTHGKEVVLNMAKSKSNSKITTLRNTVASKIRNLSAVGTKSLKSKKVEIKKQFET